MSKQIIHIEIESDKFDLNGYTCELSSNSFVPLTRQNQSKERNYFNSHQQVIQLNKF